MDKDTPTKCVEVYIGLESREWHGGTVTVKVPEDYDEEQVKDHVRQQISDEEIDPWDVCKWQDSETIGEPEVKLHKNRQEKTE